MLATEPRLRFLDPTAGPIEDAGLMAPGVGDLAGKRIGLLHNSKRGAREFLDYLAELIEGRHPGVTFVRGRKLDATSVCPPTIIDDLVSRSDLVITAVGD